MGRALATDKPNVVILLADDLGWKDLGYDGGPVRALVLDGLAQSGVRFTDFYSGAAVCSPSVAMRDGRYSLVGYRDLEFPKDREAEKVRGEFIRLNMFQESWVPMILASGCSRFELYDLVSDPGQRTEFLKEKPEVFSRLLHLHADVVSGAVECAER